METILVIAMCATFQGEDKCLASWAGPLDSEACEMTKVRMIYDLRRQAAEAGGEVFWFDAQCHKVKP